MTEQSPPGSAIRKFSSPEVIFGEGAFALLGRYAAQFRGRQALLVTDAGVRQAGLAQRAEGLLRQEAVSFSVYERDAFAPQDQEIMAGAEDYLRRRCDLLIAVGGGSVMDCAKGIGAVVGNGRHILSLAGGASTILPGPPLICAPTTPGSGAEASQFVILTDSRRRRKVVAVGRALAPNLALIDPDVAATMSPPALAYTGLDAVCHAVEAYVSTAGSSLTDLHAIEALRILGGLLGQKPDPGDPSQRQAFFWGGLHAGMAFSNAGLGLAHCLALALESLTGIEHALCVAWALCLAVRYNYPAAPQRFEAIGQALGATAGSRGGAAACDALLEYLNDLYQRLGFDVRMLLARLPENWPASISELAVSNVFLATNPTVPEQGDLERWLAQAPRDDGCR